MKPEGSDKRSYRFSFYPVDESGIVAADNLFMFSLTVTSSTHYESENQLPIVSYHDFSSLLVLQDESESDDFSEELSEQGIDIWESGVSVKRKRPPSNEAQIPSNSDSHSKRRRSSSQIDIFEERVENSSVKIEGNDKHRVQLRETGVASDLEDSILCTFSPPPR
jgi:hypothetical protein